MSTFMDAQSSFIVFTTLHFTFSQASLIQFKLFYPSFLRSISYHLHLGLLSGVLSSGFLNNFLRNYCHYSDYIVSYLQRAEYRTVTSPIHVEKKHTKVYSSPTYLQINSQGFWQSCMTHITGFLGFVQRFGNWICLPPYVRWETPALLGPLERTNLNHWATYLR
jgi:hypothetical protein